MSDKKKKLVISEGARRRMQELANLKPINKMEPTVKPLSPEEEAIFKALKDKENKWRQLNEAKTHIGQHENFHDGRPQDEGPDHPMYEEKGDKLDSEEESRDSSGAKGEPSVRTSNTTADPMMPKNVANQYDKKQSKAGGKMKGSLCENELPPLPEDEDGDIPVEDDIPEAEGMGMGEEQVQQILTAIADAVSEVTGVDVGVDSSPDELEGDMGMDDMEDMGEMPEEDPMPPEEDMMQEKSLSGESDLNEDNLDEEKVEEMAAHSKESGNKLEEMKSQLGETILNSVLEKVTARLKGE